MNLEEKIKRLLSVSQDIQYKNAINTGDLVFMSRLFTKVTLPHRDPGISRYTRRNGNVSISMIDAHERGLPYGIMPRLILIWICTQVVQKKSKRIQLDHHLADFMRQLAVIPSGGENGPSQSLKAQLVKLLSCVLAFDSSSSSIVNLENVVVANSIRLWKFDDDRGHENVSYIELSDEFFKEVIYKPVPLDMRVVNALRPSPFAIDIYIWISYRVSNLKKPQWIPWSGLQSQFGAGYKDNKAGRGNFQRRFTEYLKMIEVLYPEINYEVYRGRLLLHPSKPHISKIN